MSEIQFTKQERDRLLHKLQAYCADELEVELGQFDVEFLLDFISKEFGTAYYNQGLYDAQAILETKMVYLTEAIAELEK